MLQGFLITACSDCSPSASLSHRFLLSWVFRNSPSANLRHSRVRQGNLCPFSSTILSSSSATTPVVSGIHHTTPLCRRAAPGTAASCRSDASWGTPSWRKSGLAHRRLLPRRQRGGLDVSASREHARCTGHVTIVHHARLARSGL